MSDGKNAYPDEAKNVPQEPRPEPIETNPDAILLTQEEEKYITEFKEALSKNEVYPGLVARGNILRAIALKNRKLLENLKKDANEQCSEFGLHEVHRDQIHRYIDAALEAVNYQPPKQSKEFKRYAQGVLTGVLITLLGVLAARSLNRDAEETEEPAPGEHAAKLANNKLFYKLLPEDEARLVKQANAVLANPKAMDKFAQELEIENAEGAKALTEVLQLDRWDRKAELFHKMRRALAKALEGIDLPDEKAVPKLKAVQR